jgi:sugar/nucleoside kinase (ribokinase family)
LAGVTVPHVAVIGDVVVDVRVEARSLETGGDAPGRVRLRPGGQGANAAAWAATRARATLLTRVGDDGAGRWLREELRAAGVVEGVAVDPDAATGAILVAVRGGERSMVPDRGANARLVPEDVPDPLEADAVLVSGYVVLDDRTREAGRAALERSRAPHVAVDAASWPLLEAMGPGEFLEGCRGATLVTANHREARALTGRNGAEAARALAARFDRAAVKLEHGGAVLADGDRVIEAPIDPVEPVDPTGAGDAFAGVLLAALAGGSPADEALREAATAAARAVASPETWPER